MRTARLWLAPLAIICATASLVMAAASKVFVGVRAHLDPAGMPAAQIDAGLRILSLELVFLAVAVVAALLGLRRSEGVVAVIALVFALLVGIAHVAIM